MKSCPRCRTALACSRFPGRLFDGPSGEAMIVEMDQCRRCSGQWFDRFEAEVTMGLAGELLELVEIAAALPTCHECDRTFEQDHVDVCPGCDGPVALPCPCCTSSSTLIPVRIVSVTIDVCAACRGIWLDRSELKRIHAAVERLHLEIDGEGRLVALCLRCGRDGLTRGETFYTSEGTLCTDCVSLGVHPNDRSRRVRSRAGDAWSRGRRAEEDMMRVIRAWSNIAYA